MSSRFITGAVACLCLLIGAANAHAAYVLEPLTTFGGGNGYLSPGEVSFITTGDNNQRGIAYNAANNHLYVVNRTGGLSVPILDGNSGEQLGALNTTGITGGTFAASLIRVADDGAIYAANLTTSTNTGTGALKIYRWATESATPSLVYTGDVGLPGTRFGDSFDVRGSGTNTQLLLGQGANTAGTTNFAVFTTTDGNNFTPQVFNPAGIANGDFRLAIAFGAGNTIYGKQPSTGSAVRHISFDPATGTATLLNSNTTFPALFTGIDYDPTLDLLAGVTVGGSPNPQSTLLYEENNFTDATLADTELFVTQNANGNGSSAIAFGNGRVYALSTNNGIGAYLIVVPEPASIGLLALGGLTLLARRRR